MDPYPPVTPALILLFYGGFAFLVARMAKERGRGFFRWLVVSLLLTPVLGGLLLVLLGKPESPSDQSERPHRSGNGNR